MPHKRRLLRIALTLGALGSLIAAPAASADLDQVNTKKLRDAVTVNGILAHERALQAIANANGGTRAAGTPGYAASVAYVADKLERAGYQVTKQEFTFPFFRDLVEPTLTVGGHGYETATFQFSGSGTVTGKVVPVNDIQIPPGDEPGSSNAGCEEADFTPASETDPEIALIQRGTCTFETKAANAEAAGYDAVIIFNEGQPGRTDLTTGTLGRIFALPVVGLSFADGATLYAATQADTVTATVTTLTESDPSAVTTNVIADSPDGDPAETVVVGAHLDSVIEGGGINDNGSGVAGTLEIAEELAELGAQPRRALRFAFWGAEESGLLGSEHYVGSLSPSEVGDIYANLNFDMIGSPNFVRFVYDGDGSDTGTAGPYGSGQLESLFTSYFVGRGKATAPTAFDGRSDYGPFIAAGIPAGGLFTGAEGIKTEAEARIYGGTAGEPYDPCYHQACDVFTNVNASVLHELTDGAAHATWTLASSRSGLYEDGSRAGTRKVKVRAQAGPAAEL